MQLIDITNKKFGKLTVLNYTGLEKKRHSLWRCVCDCGVIKDVRGFMLRSGRSKSCGCSRELHNPDKAKMNNAARVFKACYNDGNISLEEFIALSQNSCHYCNSPPTNKCNRYLHKGRKSSQFAKNNGTFIYNGLDRVDNTLPHNSNNVVT